MTAIKAMEIIISHNSIPPTVLTITDYGYMLSYGKNNVAFSKEEAFRLVQSIVNTELEIKMG